MKFSVSRSLPLALWVCFGIPAGTAQAQPNPGGTLAPRVQLYQQISGEQLRSLQMAVSRDSTGPIKDAMLRGVDPNVADDKRNTLLHLALMEESRRAFEVLLAQPLIDVNAINQAGETPLMLAVLKGNLEWAKALVAKGALINEAGFSALHYAASGPDQGTVDWLLAQGAEVDARSPNDSTPLMLAAGYGSQDIVPKLLKAGANPRLKNQQGLSAADFAQRAGRDRLERQLRQAEQSTAAH